MGFLTHGRADSATGVADAVVITPASVDATLSLITPSDVLEPGGDSLEAFLSGVIGDLGIHIGGSGGLIEVHGHRRPACHTPVGGDAGRGAPSRPDAGAPLACAAVIHESSTASVTVDVVEINDTESGLVRITVAYN